MHSFCRGVVPFCPRGWHTSWCNLSHRRLEVSCCVSIFKYVCISVNFCPAANRGTFIILYYKILVLHYTTLWILDILVLIFTNPIFILILPIFNMQCFYAVFICMLYTYLSFTYYNAGLVARHLFTTFYIFVLLPVEYSKNFLCFLSDIPWNQDVNFWFVILYICI